MKRTIQDVVIVEARKKLWHVMLRLVSRQLMVVAFSQKRKPTKSEIRERLVADGILEV